MEPTARNNTMLGAPLCSDSKRSSLIPHLRQAIIVGLSAMALLVLAFSAHGQTITNGEFAMTTGNTTSFGMASGTGGPSAPDNWTFSGGIGCVVFPSSTSSQTNACGPSNPIVTLWPGWTLSPNGGNFVAIDGDPTYAGYLSQQISGFTIGQSYTVSFWQAASEFQGHIGNYFTEKWRVTFDDPDPTSPYASKGACDPKVLTNNTMCQGQDSLTMVPPLVGSGATQHSGFFSWIPQSMTFMAHHMVEVLSFFAVGTPANGAAPPTVLLDSVSITPQDAYIEICKQSDTTNPLTAKDPTSYFYTVPGSAFSSPPGVQVPVGECSGPIPVAPVGGTATITELPTPGVGISAIAATGYSPSPFSAFEPDLLVTPSPQNPATVIVQAPASPGDTSGETIVTFTNYEAPPAELKVCKVAGNTSVPAGTPFTFTVNGGAGFTVEAGPPAEGGYCVVVPGTFQVGTSVSVTEAEPLLYAVPTVTVNGASAQGNGCTPSGAMQSCGVTALIGPGINEVSFSNSANQIQQGTGEGAFSNLDIVNYSLVSQVAATGARSYMKYRAELLNRGTTTLGPMVARLSSLDSSSVQVVGRGELNFASAPANSQVASSNTFTILTDPTVPLDFSRLSWTYQSGRSVRPRR